MRMKVASTRRSNGVARSIGAALLSVVATVSLAKGAALASSPDFPRPAKIEPAVQFWARIFASYSEHQVVVHDDWYLGKVYEVLDFRPWYADGESETNETASLRRAKVDEAKERVRAILTRLHGLGPDPDTSQLSEDERKVFALFADVSGSSKFLAAADRVRSQSGLRERFAAGIAEQSRYLAAMEEVFRRHGLPIELARLPLVESCFDVEAYSKVGAAGVWQFMPATGRQYMRVASDVDERRDPMRSTEAAAEHLGLDHDVLGAWPLAITAYNHGRGGMARAVSEIGTADIGEIATRYRGKAFGFASRNFYAEFLAALDVTANAEAHFGEMPTVAPLDAIEVMLPRPIHLATAARRIGVDTDELIELNPALLPPVTGGNRTMPRGYVLRIPRGAAQSATRVAAALDVTEPSAARSVASASSRSRKGSSARVVASGKTRVSPKAAQKVVVHKVSPGQTLTDIARRYGTTVALLQGLNNLSRPRDLQAGQRLKVPGGRT
jgi:peptidoglycan lytic transglycosylase D